MTRNIFWSILFHQKRHWFVARWCRRHNLLLCRVVFCFLALEQCFICATSKPHPLHPLILWCHFTNKCHSKFCTTNLSICYRPHFYHYVFLLSNARALTNLLLEFLSIVPRNMWWGIRACLCLFRHKLMYYSAKIFASCIRLRKWFW